MGRIAGLLGLGFAGWRLWWTGGAGGRRFWADAQRRSWGCRSGASAGAELAGSRLGVAGTAYAVDRRRVAPAGVRERVVAGHVPVREGASR
ncbi:hypothetical protein [Streptomyces sp. NPDC098781]|uniref:hypothetical protein n=1 Tax=Streptomyces sp. NPDC098781 TaxID=3366097 RepID=UPI0037F28CCE